jgi:hypothetical protein
VDAETKESTRKTEEKLDGRYKEGHERKKPKCRPVGRRKQWSLGVGQRRTLFFFKEYISDSQSVMYIPLVEAPSNFFGSLKIF